MSAHLVLRAEGRDETVVSLEKLPLVMGRGREVDLTLASPLVSRRHCEIYQADDRICVRDLESLNGTFIGEDRVEDTELSTGDLLTVGAATFEVVLDDSAASAAPSEDVDELDDSAFEGFGNDAAADDDATEDAGEFSFDFDGKDESKKDADKKSPSKDAPAADTEAPTIHVKKGAGPKTSSPAEGDEDLDDFLKHFE